MKNANSSAAPDAHIAWRRELSLTLFHGQHLPEALLAVGKSSVILLHPPLPLVGVSIETMVECQQNDSLADG